MTKAYASNRNQLIVDIQQRRIALPRRYVAFLEEIFQGFSRSIGFNLQL
jgi:hypothetical protein